VIVVPEKNSGGVEEDNEDGMSGYGSEQYLAITPRNSLSLSRESLSKETSGDFMNLEGYDTNRYEGYRKSAKNREGERGLGLINYQNASGSYFFLPPSQHPEKLDTPQTIPTTFLQPIGVDRRDVKGGL
jgi:hypothetical protein